MYIRRTFFILLLMALVFSGNVVQIENYKFNISIMFLVDYYVLAFILINLEGKAKYLSILKEHLGNLCILVVLCIPLFLFLEHDMIVKNILANDNLLEAILKDRFNYFFVLCFCFYVGQILYVSSFELVPQKNIYFEFLVRIAIFMTIQSILFYTISLGIINPGHNVNLLDVLYNIFINGLIIRYIVLLICVVPYQFIYNSKVKQINVQHTN